MKKKKIGFYVGALAVALAGVTTLSVVGITQSFTPTVASDVANLYCADMTFGTSEYEGNDILNTGDWKETVEGGVGKLNPGISSASAAYAVPNSALRLEANGTITFSFPKDGVAIRGVRVIATVNDAPATLSLSSSAHASPLTTVIENTGEPDISDSADQKLNYVEGLDNGTGAFSTTFTISTDKEVDIAKIVFTIVGNSEEAKTYSYVTFTNPSTGETKGSWIQNGTELRLSDAPIYGDGSSYYLYRNNEGEALNDHPVVNRSMHFSAETVDGTATSSIAANYAENLTPGDNPKLANAVTTESGVYGMNNSSITISKINTKGNGYDEAVSVNLQDGNTRVYNAISQRLIKNADGSVAAPSPNGGGYANFPGDFTIALEDTENSNGEGTVNADYKPFEGTTTLGANGVGPTNYVSTRITLGSDQYLSGSLELGGITGYWGSQKKKASDLFAMINHQGAIISSYSELDLAGHDLVVGNGASILSYGSITDSVGGGKIILLSGASLQSPIVAEDGIKEASYVFSYAYSGQPITMWRMPYINADVEIHAGANVSGNIRAALGGTSVDSIDDTIELVGSSEAGANGTRNDSDDPLIVLTEGKIVRSVSYDQELKTKLKNAYKPGTNLWDQPDTGYMNLAYQRIHYDAYEADVTFNHYSMNITNPLRASLNSDRAPFYVAPYFDVSLHENSNLTLKNHLVFMPGSSLQFDDTSSLNISYNPDKVSSSISTGLVGSETINFQGIGGLTALSSTDITASKKYITGTTMLDSIGGNVFWKNDTFWNYMNAKGAYVELPENFTIDSTLNSELGGKYEFGGKLHVAGDLRSKFEENSSLINFTSRTSINFGNYKVLGSTTIIYAGYHVVPTELVTSTDSYVMNPLNSSFVSGSYNQKTGILTTGDAQYAFVFDSYGAPSLQDRYGDNYNGSWKSASVSGGIITADSQEYILYSGALLPVQSKTSETNVTASFTKFFNFQSGLIGSKTHLSDNQTFQYSNDKWVMGTVATE